jgi:maltose alpha-D-glucosyltransferase/alpha-amylase
MLLERRKHKAFGQGTIRFLHPQNRKVLAYLREHEDDTILCVANMSRTAQAVELDLSEFEGATPVELSGDTAFPLVGQLTYLLTLPPHGFYWFCLSKNAQPPVWSSATSGPVVEHHTFVLRHSLADIATGDHSRAVLKRDVLPAYIRERRWFQQKDAKNFSVDLAIISQLGDRSDILYVEITVEADGRNEHYALPLAIAWEDAPSSPFEAPLALARVRKGPRVGLMTDAFAVPAFAHDVLNGLRERRQIRIGKCGLDFRPTPAISELAIAPNATADWPGAEQTNSTVILGRSAVIKLLRRLTPGVHPEAEMARELTSRGFTGTPTFYGEVVRTSSDGEEATLVVAQAYVQNQGDGWHWTLDRMGPLLDENAVPTNKDEYDFANYSAFASRAGERVGEMHRILAAESSNLAFAPERFTDTDAKAICDRLMAMFDLALKKAEISQNSAAPELAKAIAKKRSGIARAAAAILAGAKGAYRTRIHGDLHLGQLLLAGDDVMVIDFEGEPFKTVDQRREKDLPLRDVAGMLRSFNYAAAYIQRSTKQTTADGKARAENFARRFNERASSFFLEGYQRGSEKKLTRGDQAILSVYMLEKAAYEVTYEAASRPDWLMVPLKGLSAIADTLLASAEHADA